MFCPGLVFERRYHVDRPGKFTLIKQSRLSVLNEMHTNSYTGPRFIPKSNTNTARQEEIQNITLSTSDSSSTVQKTTTFDS